MQQPDPGPIVVVSDAPSWLEYVTAAGTAGAAIAGALAAAAAWRSASAARSTAADAAETARRALEALSRALRTERLQVSVWRGDIDPQDYGTPEQWPGPLRIQVTNRGTITAGDVRATITDTRGQTWPTLGPATIQQAYALCSVAVVTSSAPHTHAGGVALMVDDRLRPWNLFSRKLHACEFVWRSGEAYYDQPNVGRWRPRAGHRGGRPG